MAHILILGGGAAGLAAALAAAQTDPTARVTVLERSPRPGKKLLATGNGRCNLDNEGITPQSYSSADRAALDALLRTVNAADPLGWFRALGLYTRTDETGRVYPYSNQAADVLALLEHHLARCGVEVRTGCTVQTLSQNRGGFWDGTARRGFAALRPAARPLPKAQCRLKPPQRPTQSSASPTK